jgi:methyl-accepting chemotaxis protein
MLSNVSVVLRLALSSVTTVIILAIVVLSAVSIFKDIKQGMDSVYYDSVVPIKELHRISEDYSKLIITAVERANQGMRTAESTSESLRKAKKDVDTNWTAYKSTHMGKEETQVANDAQVLFEAADKVIDNAISHLSTLSGTTNGKMSDILNMLYQAIDPVSSKINELIGLQIKEAQGIRGRIDNEANKATDSYLFGALLALILVIALNWIVNRSILNPIKEFKTVMSSIEKDSDLTLMVNLHTRDEFGETAAVFNKMMRRIDSLVGDLRSSTFQLSSASEELSNIADQATENTEKQHLESDQVATAMNQMSSTVQELSTSTSEAQSAAETADDLARNGQNIANQSMVLITDLLNEIKATSDLLKKLDSESQNIGSVVDVINGIAEQTNLLALNAAIEAARAGEQGRGFAVVADEVRTLAQKTQSSTQEIRDVVERLQQGAQAAVAAMNNGEQKSQACNESVEKGLASLTDITTAVQNIKDMNIQIAGALEEQSSVSEDINRNIMTISQMSSEISEAATNVASSGEHLSRLANGLEAKISVFKVSV